jgi:radical SAM superfamily enzyme YgiQ (UPF0313 family)
MLLPALSEAIDPNHRTIKYTRFPPLGLATLAAYLDESDQVDLQDEHVETLDLSDDPELVVIQAYTSSANRAYRLADDYRRRGAHVCLGGLHVTSMPAEAAAHADTIFLGPGEDTWPAFLEDFRAGRPAALYRSVRRSLMGMPPVRRDLIKSSLYLVPNTLVVSRGCPHHCDFCYKDAFFRGGASFYTMAVDEAVKEIQRLPGHHLCFLDDNLFGNPRFAGQLFHAMRDMGRVWLAAGTVQTVLREPKLIELAVESGMRSLFVGFETLSEDALKWVHKNHNVDRNYDLAVKRLHDLGVMVNASFVFGMDGEDESVFGRTVQWAIDQGLESSTFHILTPYPGTPLYDRLQAQGRLTTRNWDLYDTRHAVFAPAGMSASALEEGYRKANHEFGRWGAIWRAAATKEHLADRLRHLAFSSGLRQWGWLWAWINRHGWMPQMIPLLESILAAFGRYPARKHERAERAAATPCPSRFPSASQP